MHHSSSFQVGLLQVNLKIRYRSSEVVLRSPDKKPISADKRVELLHWIRHYISNNLADRKLCKLAPSDLGNSFSSAILTLRTLRREPLTGVCYNLAESKRQLILTCLGTLGIPVCRVPTIVAPKTYATHHQFNRIPPFVLVCAGSIFSAYFLPHSETLVSPRP